MKAKILLALISIISLGCSREDSQQRKAYDVAYEYEQEAVFSGALAPKIIEKYQKVIALDPDSKLAEAAQQRIDITMSHWSEYQNRLQQTTNSRSRALLETMMKEKR